MVRSYKQIQKEHCEWIECMKHKNIQKVFLYTFWDISITQYGSTVYLGMIQVVSAFWEQNGATSRLNTAAKIKKNTIAWLRESWATHWYPPCTCMPRVRTRHKPSLEAFRGLEFSSSFSYSFIVRHKKCSQPFSPRLLGLPSSQGRDYGGLRISHQIAS